MELQPLPLFCGLREGLRQHTQRNSLEDHEVLWNTDKDRANGASHVH